MTGDPLGRQQSNAVDLVVWSGFPLLGVFGRSSMFPFLRRERVDTEVGDRFVTDLAVDVV